MIHKEKKRGLWGLLALVLCCALAGCGDTGAGSESSSEETLQVTETETTTTEQTTTTEETTTTTKTTTKATTTEPPEPEVEYISERYVEYHEENDEFVVMFALEDSQDNYLEASGTAKIKITDDAGNVIYDSEIPFTESNFTDWTRPFRDDSTHGCWLTIPRGDVQPASSSSGTLELSVTGPGFSFDPESYTITDLPEKRATINLPAMPVNITDSRYSSHVCYATVNELTYESTLYYDGTMSVELTAVITLNSKSGEQNVADDVAVGYRLTDSTGMVVGSGTIYSEEIRPGEKSKGHSYVNDLDPAETYTLTLENPT